MRPFLSIRLPCTSSSSFVVTTYIALLKKIPFLVKVSSESNRRGVLCFESPAAGKRERSFRYLGMVAYHRLVGVIKPTQTTSLAPVRLRTLSSSQLWDRMPPEAPNIGPSSASLIMIMYMAVVGLDHWAEAVAGQENGAISLSKISSISQQRPPVLVSNFAFIDRLSFTLLNPFAYPPNVHISLHIRSYATH